MVKRLHKKQIPAEVTVRRLHNKQILAAVTTAAVDAGIAISIGAPLIISPFIAACLFAAIPRPGIIAVLPAVLVLVAGIAISIAAPLIILANAKRAHMQQQSSLLGHANTAVNETGSQPDAP